MLTNMHLLSLSSEYIWLSTLVLINEVTLCWAQLVLGWVAICGQVNHLSQGWCYSATCWPWNAATL